MGTAEEACSAFPDYAFIPTLFFLFLRFYSSFVVDISMSVLETDGNRLIETTSGQTTSTFSTSDQRMRS